MFVVGNYIDGFVVLCSDELLVDVFVVVDVWYVLVYVVVIGEVMWKWFV